MRATGSGRPRTSRSDDNINIIKKLVENDQTMSINSLCVQTRFSWSTVQRILREDLNKRSVSARWVPHKLSSYQKDLRIEGARRILQELHESVFVIDEKWIYCEPILPKENIRAWVDHGGPRPQQRRRNIADKKWHIIVAMNFRGSHYFEMMHQNTPINAHRYVEFLQNLMDKHRHGKFTIMQDNARPHVARYTTSFLEQNAVKRIQQPPYSPDTNLMDRMIFRNLESKRRLKTFKSEHDIKVFLEKFLAEQTRSKLIRELNRLRDDLNSIILCHGEYL